MKRILGTTVRQMAHNQFSFQLLKQITTNFLRNVYNFFLKKYRFRNLRRSSTTKCLFLILKNIKIKINTH